MTLRQQSAVEFMTTYSFAIFVLSLVLITVVTVSLSIGVSAPVYSSCNIQPLITCQQSLLTYNSVNGFKYLLIFRNNLGFLLQFPSNAINLSTTGFSSSPNALTAGSCSPSNAVQGSQVICMVHVNGKSNVKQGTNTYTQFHIYFYICQSVSTCTYNSSNFYSVTGYSFQTLSSPLTNLYNVIITSSNGLVVLNGESYLNNSVIYLPGGSGITYSLYAQPNVGYHFTTWTLSGSGSWLTPNAIQTANVILNLNSNATVTATFTH
jgi:hypothetical protein